MSSISGSPTYDVRSGLHYSNGNGSDASRWKCRGKPHARMSSAWNLCMSSSHSMHRMIRVTDSEPACSMGTIERVDFSREGKRWWSRRERVEFCREGESIGQWVDFCRAEKWLSSAQWGKVSVFWRYLKACMLWKYLKPSIFWRCLKSRIFWRYVKFES